jgi:hypothetical protein
MLIYLCFSLLAKLLSLLKVVRTEMDAMDAIVLSTFDACCTIQSLCHTLSPRQYPLQLPTHEPLALLDQQYRWDHAAEVL